MKLPKNDMNDNRINKNKWTNEWASKLKIDLNDIHFETASIYLWYMPVVSIQIFSKYTTKR